MSSKNITKVNSKKFKGMKDVEKIERVAAALSVSQKAPFIVMTASTQVYTPPPSKEIIVEIVIA